LLQTPEDPLEIAEGVYWVGVIDWNLRDFHGYETPRGGTYNAYLIIDEKITLIDTVKAEFGEEMLQRIGRIVDPSRIDYVVSNHVEKDHSSSLPMLMDVAPDATIFATERGKTGLTEYYKEDGSDEWKFEVVNTGSEINTGRHNLMFIEAVMLHWPDSMHTYLKEEHILFSNDAFGQHIATSGRFDDEVTDNIMEEAAIYYANILMPFNSRILKYVDLLGSLGLEIDMIAPSHGVIWRSNPSEIIEAYVKWASGKTVPKVIIIYDTMWKSTEMMANAIAEGVRAAGVEAKLFHLRKNDWSLLMKELMEAPVFALGSPTMHNGLFYTVGGFLTYMTGFHPKDKKAMAFGSYGWGGGAVKQIEAALERVRIERVADSLQVRFKPFSEDLRQCREAGIKLAGIARDASNTI
jgi:flavorubredoxin